MADALTTTTQVDPAVAIMYDRVLLDAAKPALVHEKFAQSRPLAKKSGNTIKFRRYANLTVAKTPLTEGVTPNGQLLSKTDLTAKISWYGDFVHITDVVDQTVEDEDWVVAAEKLGFQAGETRDELIRDILAACASSTNASSGSNGDTPTELTKADIDAVVKTLLGYNAKRMAPQIDASAKIGTGPIRKAYWGIIDADLVDDIEDVSGFKEISEYAGQNGVMEDEWGNTGNVRWLMTSKGYVSSSTYSLPIFGENAFAVTDLDGAAMSNIRKDYGHGDDPLNQRATSGWKMAFVARILNDEFMHILKVTHS